MSLALRRFFHVSFLSSSQAVYLKCDVMNWDDQVAMFDLAMSRFHAVDIVVSLAPPKYLLILLPAQ
jgi:NAD(P)-dependent dehydrogenase (short-subunit alcohol dehydrogenase family)